MFFLFYPQAVCHLPISAQLEYRRLINRMKILEKQKEQKSSQFKQQQLKMQQNVPTATFSPLNDPPFTNIRVTLKNENRIIQTNESKVHCPEERLSSASPPPPTNVVKLKDSLKKKVLMKNTLNAAAAATHASNETNATNSESSAVRSLEFKNETPLNGLQSDAIRPESEEEVSALRNTETKVKTHR